MLEPTLEESEPTYTYVKPEKLGIRDRWVEYEQGRNKRKRKEKKRLKFGWNSSLHIFLKLYIHSFLIVLRDPVEGWAPCALKLSFIVVHCVPILHFICDKNLQLITKMIYLYIFSPWLIMD